MYDLAFFRANLDAIATRLADRGLQLNVDEFRALDAERRAAVTEAESLKAQLNAKSQEIGKLKQQQADTTALQQEVRDMKERIAADEARAAAADEKYRDELSRIPNTPHASVPTGKTAGDNVEVRRTGTPREMAFEPRPHWDIGTALGILDFDRATKITGARFAVYWGQGAKLERALINFMLDVHTQHHGYTEVLPPFMVNSASMYGTGQLPKFAADLFKIDQTDFWLIPTAEVPVTNLYRDETLDLEGLPVSLCSYTPCFRSEAGSYGRDVRGIIRQHQFQKVELVKFTTPEQSYAEHEKLTADAEDILTRLGLPFRTMLLCTGDMGASSAKTYDLEVWLPSQREFKEISSCSNFEGYQARRANIRAQLQKGPGKTKPEHVHTLNGSGLAVGRTWVAIVENYQQADGSVIVPDALRPYLNAERITPQGATV
jgi:seryl-tRNA synthetase